MSRPPELRERIETLVTQLRTQAETYRSVLALGEKQRMALRRQDLGVFHELLHAKARAMATITELEGASADNRALWDNNRDAVPDDLRDAVRTAVEDLRGLLEQLLEAERSCEAELEAVKDEMRQDLQRLGTGRKALQSYRPQREQPERRGLDLGG